MSTCPRHSIALALKSHSLRLRPKTDRCALEAQRQQLHSNQRIASNQCLRTACDEEPDNPKSMLAAFSTQRSTFVFLQTSTNTGCVKVYAVVSSSNESHRLVTVMQPRISAVEQALLEHSHQTRKLTHTNYESNLQKCRWQWLPRKSEGVRAFDICQLRSQFAGTGSPASLLGVLVAAAGPFEGSVRGPSLNWPMPRTGPQFLFFPEIAYSMIAGRYKGIWARRGLGQVRKV